MDLKLCRILVTSTSYGKNDPRLKTELEKQVGEVIYNPTGKPLSSNEVARLLPGVDGYIAGLDVIDKPALQNAERLKVIARYGVGVDSVDLQAAKDRNIVVTNTPGANSVSVAELTLGLMLALARQIPEAVAATRRGQFPRLNGISLEGKIIGIIGLGAIGKQLAQRLVGFNCHILTYEPCPDQDFIHRTSVELVALDNLLSRADFVSLHLPLTQKTRGMVDAAFLGKMKEGAYLINTARGELVDEAALLNALKSGHLRGAALDALCQEPPAPDHPLLALAQVIATPHLGAQTDGATNSMGWLALEDCLAVLRGEQPAHRVV
jgi:D-3-phosphoglycerate dehydrogenase / 2-oxoglutarate reductase